MKRNKCVRQEPPNLAIAGCWDLHPNYQITPSCFRFRLVFIYPALFCASTAISFFIQAYYGYDPCTLTQTTLGDN